MRVEPSSGEISQCGDLGWFAWVLRIAAKQPMPDPRHGRWAACIMISITRIRSESPRHSSRAAGFAGVPRNPVRSRTTLASVGRGVRIGRHIWIREPLVSDVRAYASRGARCPVRTS